MIPNASTLSTLLEQKPSPEERQMLDHFSSIKSLVSSDEASVLFRMCMLLPPQKRLLEIGSYRGGSTVALGHAARLNEHTIFCIDMWAEYRQQADFSNMDISLLNDMNILGEFIENTAFIKDRLSMLRGNSGTFSELFGSNLFSLVFIDGAHDYFSVIDDIVFGLKVIEPGGILCGHDYHSQGVEVKRAVHDIVMNSETITTKGLINNTSIWYAAIEDPAYELLIANTIKQMAVRDFVAAYNILNNGRKGVKHTEEVARLLRGLETELGIRSGAT